MWQFRQGVAHARSEDASSLQKTKLIYLEYGLAVGERTIDPSKHSNRMTRGFNSEAFARLMCPHKFSTDFEQDPKRC